MPAQELPQGPSRKPSRPRHTSLCQSPLALVVTHPEVHVLHGVHDNVDELHARNHELNLEGLRMRKVSHERLEAPGLAHLALEVVEGRQDDRVAALHRQADGGQQFENEGLGAELSMDLQSKDCS